MLTTEEAHARLAAIPALTIIPNEPLSRHTRFAIGGPACLYAETANEESFVAALETARASGMETAVIGGGTNLIVSDDGFPGIVLRYRATRLESDGNCVLAEAGAELQDLVDFTVDRGLKGLETLAGIPGWVGAAVYGNAGAYGHSISERVVCVRFYDGSAVRSIPNGECHFRYRESIFKAHKEWIIFSTELRLDPADSAVLRQTASEIVAVRNQKFPVTMKCAGSIFKNLILSELPPEAASAVPTSVVREGKVPAAWFLEEVGAKGVRRGQIQVATYHANLVYNEGGGTAGDLCALIGDLKERVRSRFGILLEEEVQYVGMAPAPPFTL
ncbi:MAG: UDP-N-acetylmuramate dehydrogenase [Acidobacteriia bacterium]|nr:UDP-N-acetylmuramate dehydrogenase [Terriglobia bacterium]